ALRDGQIVQLAPKTLDVLLVLLENRGAMVPYDKLIRSVWGATASARTVDNLKEPIARLRKALGDDRAAHRFIVTAPLEGYAFVADVIVADGDSTQHGQAFRSEVARLAISKAIPIGGALIVLVAFLSGIVSSTSHRPDRAHNAPTVEARTEAILGVEQRVT